MLFSIAPLNNTHQRNTFNCHSEALTRYFQQQVNQDIKRKITACFVALNNEGVIAGYYTLAASSMLLNDLPSDIRQKLPRYPSVPAVRMGRLAVVAVADRLPVLVKSGWVEYATSTASEADEFWNGPLAALMSYGALPFVGSTTRMVTLGICPGAVLITCRTSYWNFAAAACSGITWALATRRLATSEFGPWQELQVSSVAATPP